ncbi:glycosyltransferase family 4 protein [Pontibacter sp. HSC-36F09]|uniref:glycosyltransferase family 4 protein n=1 Tax=Pontibacter sp. HSC-36F09 TaxID=2910966 RepID=UPI00209E6FB5|nr:glycosyltransferase family 4 protein [Pontibacter sp. HSC-36F09]MCP2045727.1 glycosyltransferase involved in cell wall biosynthesis [Pontibacter sp. HSC-36F09]
MKVLLYSHFFYPSIGGLENVSLTLAQLLVSSHVNCKVVTTTAADGPDNLGVEIIRNPGEKHQIRLVRWADIILFNGASLALQPWILLFKKPFIWVHTGYQVSCIDGCGWVDGERAPLTPASSVVYHVRKNGWKAGGVGGFKLLLKRIFAKYLVSRNVAITKWMYNAQPLPRQVHIYNPFPLNSFLGLKDTTIVYDFIYVGRLVSEKGVASLILAFSRVLKDVNRPTSLLIIGDGNWRAKMEAYAGELQVTQHVTFVGRKAGSELVHYVSKGRIAIVPSEWYEPMGGVALELMAAGRNLIVSELGGLKECVGDAGLTFPNGDAEALAKCMLILLTDASARNRQLRLGRDRVKEFLPSIFVAQYIDLLQKVIAEKASKTEVAQV